MSSSDGGVVEGISVASGPCMMGLRHDTSNDGASQQLCRKSSLYNINIRTKSKITKQGAEQVHNHNSNTQKNQGLANSAKCTLSIISRSECGNHGSSYILCGSDCVQVCV